MSVTLKLVNVQFDGKERRKEETMEKGKDGRMEGRKKGQKNERE
jgi:hypothetical protein